MVDEPAPEPAPEESSTTTELLALGTETHARIGSALAAVSDAAELATQLPPFVARAVLRSLSQAHRHLSDADVMTTARAVASAHVVDLAAADVTRRVLCTCGLAFTPGGWQLHLAGVDADPGATHALAGELVAAATSATRRRTVELLERGKRAADVERE